MHSVQSFTEHIDSGFWSTGVFILFSGKEMHFRLNFFFPFHFRNDPSTQNYFSESNSKTSLNTFLLTALNSALSPLNRPVFGCSARSVGGGGVFSRAAGRGLFTEHGGYAILGLARSAEVVSGSKPAKPVGIHHRKKRMVH